MPETTTATTTMRQELRAWVLDKATILTEGELTDHTPLFGQRYLRSVHVPELLLLLERLRRQPIDVDELNPADFRDIATLIDRFTIQEPTA